MLDADADACTFVGVGSMRISASIQSFRHTSCSNRFAPNLVRLSVKIRFAELKHDSEATVDTGTANMIV